MVMKCSWRFLPAAWPSRRNARGPLALSLVLGGIAACAQEPFLPAEGTPTSTGPSSTSTSTSGHDHDPGSGPVDLENAGQPMAFPSTLMDQTPDREIVDVHLRASHLVYQVGKRTVAGYAYNGQVPGPTIRVQKGQRVRVHFENALNVPSSLHWHGVNVPKSINGPTGAGALVPVGARFLYEFDATQEGTFWYHPGVDPERQIDFGLYGAFVVTDHNQPQPDYDLVMFFDVWNEIGGNHVHEPDVVPEGDGAQDDHGDHGDHAGHGYQSTGRQDDPGHGDHGPGSVPKGDTPGKVIWSVNSQIEPKLALEPGKSVRARLINVSNMGYLKLHGINGQQVGGDQGILAAPASPEGLLLAPGDRADLSGFNGDFVVRSRQYTRFGPGNDTSPELRHRVFEVSMGQGGVGKALPYGFTFEMPAEDPRRTDLLLTFQGDPRTQGWSINGERYPDITMHSLALGGRSYIELRNLSGSEQPFHLQGHAFEVLSVDGVAPTFKTVQDTLNVQRMQKVRIAVDVNNPGDWVAQSQILPHAQAGMMTVIRAQ